MAGLLLSLTAPPVEREREVPVIFEDFRETVLWERPMLALMAGTLPLVTVLLFPIPLVGVTF